MATTPWATDEDIALRARGDFRLLTSRDQVVAAGSDGLFSSQDRWVLRSATVRFLDQVVATGHVVQLLGPSLVYRPPGELLVVDEVGEDWLRLRRLGMGSGSGQPPGGSAGITGVEFQVTTLAPQIRIASDEVLGRLGLVSEGKHVGEIDEGLLVRLRDVVAFSTLADLYRNLASSSTDLETRWLSRAEMCQRQRDTIMAGLLVSSFGGSGVGLLTTRFSR